MAGLAVAVGGRWTLGPSASFPLGGGLAGGCPSALRSESQNTTARTTETAQNDRISRPRKKCIRFAPINPLRLFAIASARNSDLSLNLHVSCGNGEMPASRDWWRLTYDHIN